jgi:hypothetical protein
MAGEGVPIIYIHQAERAPRYLMASLGCAHITNPHAPIYLITDMRALPPTDYPSFEAAVTLIDINQHRTEAEEFGKIFFNVSINPGYFERWCIERWFILRSFLKERGIQRFVTLDSDVLLFCDVKKEAERFAAFDFTISSRYNWCFGIFNQVRVIDSFCAMIMEVYSKSTPLWLTVCDYLNLLRPNVPTGNLSDMTLLKLFVEQVADKEGLRYEDTARVLDGSCYCTNIALAVPEVEMCLEPCGGRERTIKKIHWVNGAPYGRLCSSGELVRFNCLHFQGESKALMAPCFDVFVQLLLRAQAQMAAAMGEC